MALTLEDTKRVLEAYPWLQPVLEEETARVLGLCSAGLAPCEYVRLRKVLLIETDRFTWGI